MRIALVFAALLALVGCKKTLHWKAIEQDLHGRLAANVPAGITFDVACPETGVEKGLTFRCHVHASDDSAIDIEVKLLDTAGSYSMEPVR
ncbi:MAG TPA: DUF4333 domain-containing protein [Kofleriaceae bacterium]|jgi:hypothetical protein|nr:DUF4333 domain-containing protein [Kofleriaceae bacterium]